MQNNLVFFQRMIWQPFKIELAIQNPFIHFLTLILLGIVGGWGLEPISASSDKGGVILDWTSRRFHCRADIETMKPSTLTFTPMVVNASE